MRLVSNILVLAFLLTIAGCASQPDGAAATNADERVICRTDREIGSTMSRRVCKTASEWQIEREEQKEGMRSIDRQPRQVSSPGETSGG
jgi:hypothetical protein